MNPFALTLLLVLLPLGIQLLLGISEVRKKLNIRYNVSTFLNIVLAIAMVFVGIEIITCDMRQQDMRCGMPLVGFFVFGFASWICLIGIIAVQIIIAKICRSSRLP